MDVAGDQGRDTADLGRILGRSREKSWFRPTGFDPLDDGRALDEYFACMLDGRNKPVRRNGVDRHQKWGPLGSRYMALNEQDRKSTRLNSSHSCASRMPYSA